MNNNQKNLREGILKKEGIYSRSPDCIFTKEKNPGSRLLTNIYEKKKKEEENDFSSGRFSQRLNEKKEEEKNNHNDKDLKEPNKAIKEIKINSVLASTKQQVLKEHNDKFSNNRRSPNERDLHISSSYQMMKIDDNLTYQSNIGTVNQTGKSNDSKLNLSKNDEKTNKKEDSPNNSIVITLNKKAISNISPSPEQKVLKTEPNQSPNKKDHCRRGN